MNQDILDHIELIILGTAETLGIDADIAMQLSAKSIDCIVDKIGGISLYIPRKNKKARRNAAIAEKWNGKNMQELVNEFQLSQVAIYSILKLSVTAGRDTRRRENRCY